MTTDSSVAKVSIVGAGIQNAPGYAARMFGALRRRRREHRDDLDLGDPDHDDHRRGRPGDRPARAPRGVRARAAGGDRSGRAPGDGTLCFAVPRPPRALRCRRLDERRRSLVAGDGRGRGLPRGRRRADRRARAGEPDMDGAGRAPRCCSRSASGRPGSSQVASGSSRRRSRWRWPTRRRPRSGSRPGRSASSGPTTWSRETGDGMSGSLAGSSGRPRAWECRDDRDRVGIGVNADWPASEFPAELASTMTSLRELG